MTQLWIICGYLALLLALGFSASRLFRGTRVDYLLASSTIGPFLLLMSLFGTTMTSFALIGSSGEAYEEGIGVYGMMASASGIIHSLCFFLIGVKLWSFGQRYGYSTQIEFFRDRLESNGIGLLLFPILVGLVVPYLLMGVIGGGRVIETVTAGAFPDAFAQTRGGLPHQYGGLIICAVVLCYVFFGGMRGTAWANAFQTCVFMALGMVTFIVIANRLGGQDSLMENLRVLGEAVPPEKATRMHMSKTQFFTYMLIPFSVGMFPHLFQHWLTARSAATFKLAVVAHPVFIMIVWVPCIMIGIWATTDLVTLPQHIANNPNAILGYLVGSQAGAVLGGLLAAGILAAIMSSLDSQFLCLGTIFSTDVVNHFLGRERFTDRQQVWIARGFIVAIVAVTYLLSLFDQPRVFTLGVWCFTGFASLFPLVFAAIYWPRLTKAGSYAGVLAMAAVWIYLFRQSDYSRIAEYTVSVGYGGYEYETMPVLWTFLAAVVAMVAVSLVTRPPSERTLRKFFNPKAAAE